MNTPHHYEAIIIGGGQSALATAYYLDRNSVDFLILDNGTEPGGAWQHFWPTMKLFSGSTFSSLPGMQMPHIDGELGPHHVVEYLINYEARYDFPIQRPVTVNTVEPADHGFVVHTDAGEYSAEQVIMATGIWSHPIVPSYPGSIIGQYWHAANYPGPDTFTGTKVAVLGAGNSGAQIAAELSDVADVTWYTRDTPKFMPDDVDGTELFRRQRARALALLRGDDDLPDDPSHLGDIVMTPLVARARDAGRLEATPMVKSLDELDVNHFIWATGFEPQLGPIKNLIDASGQPTVPGLHLVGYGGPEEPGSATLVGVGPWAKKTATEVAAAVGKGD